MTNNPSYFEQSKITEEKSFITLGQSGKFLPGTNALAYLAFSMVTKMEKGFMSMTPGVNVIKPFFFIANDEAQ